MKNNIINIILILIITVFTFTFSNINLTDNIDFVISLIFSITIIMFYKRKSIKNKLYNIINDMFLVLSILSLGYIIICTIDCIVDIHCYNNYVFQGIVILYTSLLTLLFINIIDIKKKKNNLYNMLFLIVNIIVITIYLRYYFDNSFIHNYMNINRDSIYVTYIYIIQNYVYFNILYISLLIGHFINKKEF